ncbi:hypothetical protein Bsp3421_003908 [Burkholderia sp. FERM BP-3421]|uniref:hypothetical protein n=1 Tax=Burkholderia sp. FERM BP-3421 TaxID=1494466 RepID=UPI00235E4158|nr:hypothetical protein [Burkholderia sp. FERM BP-3421]WDD93808.1 hypothetical protein Bsp3421_003908 [Burkholderia sp. FERM BP-3421]
MTLDSSQFRLHDLSQFPMCLFRSTEATEGYASTWIAEMEALVAAGKPFTVVYQALGDEAHEDRKQRGLWLKRNKVELGAVCQATITVEPDAKRRAELEAWAEGAVKAFGIPHKAVPTLADAAAVTLELCVNDTRGHAPADA